MEKVKIEDKSSEEINREVKSSVVETEPAAIDDESQIDPASSSFVPLRAIYDHEFETDDDSKCHDNVERCIAVMEGRVRTAKPKADNAKAAPPAEEKLERQFLASQLPVPGRSRKEFRHVLSRMGEFNTGPMSVLKRCMEEGERVKVWTRGVLGIRGVTTGFLAAFDKHWNMALTDVDEQFTRRRSRKAPVLGGVGAGVVGVGETREFRVGESLVKILKVKKKVEVCVRHVPQVLLRGEHVVMVASNTNPTADKMGNSTTTTTDKSLKS